MGQADMTDDELDQHVAQILDELIGIALRTAKGSVDRPVDSAVPLFWRAHYTAKFFYAVRMKNRVYADDRAKLIEKAEELGTVASRLARLGSITTLHAALASYEVDCAGIKNMEHWCN